MEGKSIAPEVLGCGTLETILAGAGKPSFVAPKLTFVKPELVRQGSLADVTAGFFGTFVPGGMDV